MRGASAERVRGYDGSHPANAAEEIQDEVHQLIPSSLLWRAYHCQHVIDAILLKNQGSHLVVDLEYFCRGKAICQSTRRSLHLPFAHGFLPNHASPASAPSSSGSPAGSGIGCGCPVGGVTVGGVVTICPHARGAGAA